MNLLNTICLVYQSEKDEMVSRRSAKYFENKPNVLVNKLKKSGHYYYDKEDFDFLITEFKKILNMDS